MDSAGAGVPVAFTVSPLRSPSPSVITVGLVKTGVTPTTSWAALLFADPSVLVNTAR
jgi:hypothetical protein